MEKIVNELKFEVRNLTNLLIAKENEIRVLKMQNLDLYVKLEKFKRKKKLKL